MRRWVIIIAPCWLLLYVAAVAAGLAAGVVLAAAALAAAAVIAIIATFVFWWMPASLWRELAGPGGSPRVATAAIAAWISVVVGFTAWIL